MSRPAPGGVYAATLTPFDSSYRPDAIAAIPYYGELLESGCDGLNLLGTTGEAISIALEERLRFMDVIAASGLPRERMMVGTGAAALGDAIRLTSAACESGFRAALIIPPFYYRGAGDDGIVRYYEALVRSAGPPTQSVILYNFPAMSGITFHVDLVRRIVEACGPSIAGVKDSSNDLVLERALQEAIPALAIFPGSEQTLWEVRDAGLAGCISGSVCLWPQLAAEVWRTGDEGKAADLRARREALRGEPLIAAVRRRVARERGELWLRSIPPL